MYVAILDQALRQSEAQLHLAKDARPAAIVCLQISKLTSSAAL